jgi:hypothetical protein
MEKYYEQSKNVNLCAARAYYVPFEKGQAVSYDRADSARFVDLNGIWKIKAYETVLDAENFLMEECEKEIPVPSCVQYHGLDWFQYTNLLSVPVCGDGNTESKPCVSLYAHVYFAERSERKNLFRDRRRR